MTLPRPPGPRLGFPGVHYSLYADPIGFLTRAARRFGDLTCFNALGQTFYLVNHPDWIRQVFITEQANLGRRFIRIFGRRNWLELFLGEGLITSNGDRHRSQRARAQPAFHHDGICAWGKIMVESAIALCRRWQDGQIIDLDVEMSRLGAMITGRALFGALTEDEAEQIAGASRTIHDLSGRLSMPFAEWLQGLPLRSARRFRQARSRVDAIVFRIIRERQRTSAGADDLLAVLMRKGDQSDRELRDQLVNFSAGGETTSAALMWTFYLLSQHEQVREKLHAELDEVLGGRLPAPEDLGGLQYTRKAFAEALRLYPPIWIEGRRVARSFSVGDYRLPADAVVVVSQYLVHRDARFYPQPHRFEPERWGPEEMATRSRFVYLPFGVGSRQCIGEDFAWTEGVMVTAAISQQWRMRPVVDRPIELQLGATLRPKKGLPMIVERRRS